MSLQITFIFPDKRPDAVVSMQYENFNRFEICKGNEKSHEENIKIYGCLSAACMAERCAWC